MRKHRSSNFYLILKKNSKLQIKYREKTSPPTGVHGGKYALFGGLVFPGILIPSQGVNNFEIEPDNMPCELGLIITLNITLGLIHVQD